MEITSIVDPLTKAYNKITQNGNLLLQYYLDSRSVAADQYNKGETSSMIDHFPV